MRKEQVHKNDLRKITNDSKIYKTMYLSIAQALALAWFLVQYEKYFPSFLYFGDLFDRLSGV